MQGRWRDRRPFSTDPPGPDERPAGQGEPADDTEAEPFSATAPVRIPIEDSLDLHAFEPKDIPSVVDEYIRAASAAGFGEVRLIHGRGTGVQRGIVQQVLEQHPFVLEFRDAPESHLGATIARLVSGNG